jgi:DNA-binding MarR family transcriptional regulator
MQATGSAAEAMASEADPGLLASSLRLAVMRLARRLRQQSVGEVTASQYSALSSVEKAGVLTLGELACIERVAPPSMTRIAVRLEEMGLVERTPDPADRRVARVRVTTRGAELLAETRTRRDLFLAERLAGLSPGDAMLLARALPLLQRLGGDEPAEAVAHR